MQLELRRCGYCNGNLFWGDGLFDGDDCRWYHENCMLSKSHKRKTILSKKLKAETITLEEAKELQGLEVLIANIQKDPITTPLSKILGEPSTESVCFSGKSKGKQLVDNLRTKALESAERKRLEEPNIVVQIQPKAKKKLLEAAAGW